MEQIRRMLADIINICAKDLKEWDKLIKDVQQYGLKLEWKLDLVVALERISRNYEGLLESLEYLANENREGDVRREEVIQRLVNKIVDNYEGLSTKEMVNDIVCDLIDVDADYVSMIYPLIDLGITVDVDRSIKQALEHITGGHEYLFEHIEAIQFSNIEEEVADCLYCLVNKILENYGIH